MPLPRHRQRKARDTHTLLPPFEDIAASKVPERAKSMQAGGFAALHHFVVALPVTRDEDDLCAKARPRILEELHCIRAAAALLRVPQDHALRLDMIMDEGGDGGAECALLVGADPDEEPILALDAGRERRADARARADADAAFEHGRGVANTGFAVSATTGKGDRPRYTGTYRT